MANALIHKTPPYSEAEAGFISVDGVYRKIKKVFETVDGVHKLLWSFGPDVAGMAITYSGNMTDEVVTMGDGKQYRILTLTSTGTLTLEEAVNAEVWLCGGGGNGADATMEEYGDTLSGGAGGNGGGFYQFIQELATSIVVTIGAGGGGITSFGSVKSSGHYNGAGGGKPGYSNLVISGVAYSGSGGSAASRSTRPFDDSYFSNLPCAGGGGGQGRTHSYTGGGGAGGSSTNAGATGACEKYSIGSEFGGDGGATGGGKGAYSGSSKMADFVAATNATYYGSGGGGGGIHNPDTTLTNRGGDGNPGGSGYQGICYVRIPLEQ